MLAAPIWYSRETTQVAKATLIRVLSHIRRGKTVVIQKGHSADACEAPVVENARCNTTTIFSPA
jgi:hypothetical protein